jgi:hypothetical protein
MVVNRACGNESTTKNLGGKKQCLEAPVKTIALAKSGFRFASEADANDKSKWLDAIKSKNIVPLPNIEGVEANNTDAQIKNGRYKDYKLKEGVSGSKYRIDTAICTYANLKTYEDSDYTRVFQITDAEEVTGELFENGSFGGRNLTSILIGLRNEATDSDVPFNDVFLKYESDVYSIIKPEFEASELEGIEDVSLVLESATATSIKFKAYTSCSSSPISSLEYTHFTIKDTDGAVVSTGNVPVDPNGVYELTGTGFLTDYTVEINGVVSVTEMLYEGIEPLKITVS